MANAVINTSAMAAENVSAYKKVGVYTSADVMNGTIVTLGAMNVDGTSKVVKDFSYAVALGTANIAAGTDFYIVVTPEIPAGVANVYDDPREFTNKAGKPLSLNRVLVGDTIEVTAEVFASANDFPIASEVGYVIPTAANGKLGTPASSSDYAAFKVEALSTMTFGNELVSSCILRRVA